MDSCVVPHRSTNRAVLWLTAQIGRDAVLSESYGRRHPLHPRDRLCSGSVWGVFFFIFFSGGPQAPLSPPPPYKKERKIE